jgi:hypothetical protein
MVSGECMVIESGEEYNFAFQMPKRKGDPNITYVVPSCLQMGWKNSPAYFCITMQTTRELIKWMLALTIHTGIKEPHKHEKHYIPNPSPNPAPPWIRFLMTRPSQPTACKTKPPGRPRQRYTAPKTPPTNIMDLAQASLVHICTVVPPNLPHYHGTLGTAAVGARGGYGCHAQSPFIQPSGASSGLLISKQQ